MPVTGKEMNFSVNLYHLDLFWFSLFNNVFQLQWVYCTNWKDGFDDLLKKMCKEAFLVSPIPATYPAFLSLLDFTVIKMLNDLFSVIIVVE